MANILLSPSIITKEALMTLHQKSILIRSVNREYDNRFAQTGAKIGEQLNLRRPVKWTTRSGATYSSQDVKEYTSPLVMATQVGIDWEFTTKDFTLTIDEFRARYLDTAMAQLAATIESDFFNIYKKIYNQTGTPGTAITTIQPYLLSQAKLTNNLTPPDNRTMLVNPTTMANTVFGGAGYFHSGSQIEMGFKKGMYKDVAGFDLGTTTLTKTHTVGTYGAGPVLTNGAVTPLTTGWADTQTITIDGLPASQTGALKEGDILTFTACNRVHPESRENTGELQQFTVTADVNSNGSGEASVTVSPAFITAGSYQNITAAPGDGVTITVQGTSAGTYKINLGFHKDAFTIVSADLYKPDGVDRAARYEFEGISMRFIRDYDSTNDKIISRFDVLYGFAPMQKELATRMVE